MAETFRTQFTRPLPLLLAALALLGWLAAIWLATSRSTLERDLTAEVEQSTAAQVELQAALTALEDASGSLDEIEAQIETGTQDLATLGTERDTARTEFETELAALTAEIEAARRNFEIELAQLTQRGQAARGQAVSAERELARLSEGSARERAALADLQREQIATVQMLQETQARLGIAEVRVTAQTRKLAQVGDRLAQAREQSAETRTTLAALSQEAADLDTELADAERRMQQARESEAATQRALRSARSEFSRMEAHRGSLEHAIAELRTRRAALEEDVNAAEAQRSRLQEQITELSATLAERSERLETLEERIAELQDRGAALSAAGTPMLAPGDYRAGPVDASFASDGSFTLSNTQRDATVRGAWDVEDDVLVLSDASGALGGAEFPLRCRIVPDGDGFRLAEGGDACGALDGVSFRPAQASP